MTRRRLSVPLRLTVIVVGATLAPACASHNSPPPSPCPTDYFCTTDAARAVACTDAGSPNGIFESDLGACFPPV